MLLSQCTMSPAPITLDYLDFKPTSNENECNQSESVFQFLFKRFGYKDVKYCNFDSLIEQLNRWLCRNPRFQVIFCEMITEKSTARANAELRILRAWITPSWCGEIQNIAYVDIVPIGFHSNAFYVPRNLSNIVYEPLESAYSRFNFELQRGTVTVGKILNVSTVSHWITEQDNRPLQVRRSLVMKGEKYNREIQFLRVFFNTGMPGTGNIEFLDFTPSLVDRSSPGDTLPKYESFFSLFQRMQEWILQEAPQRYIDVVNVETVKVRAMDYYVEKEPEEGLRKRWFTCLRVHYTRRNAVENMLLPPPYPMTVQYMTAIPPSLSNARTNRYGYMETFRDTVKRACSNLRVQTRQLLGVATLDAPRKIKNTNVCVEKIRNEKKEKSQGIRIFWMQ